MAPLLRQLHEDTSNLTIGSYPCFTNEAPYRVLVTLESKDKGQLHECAARLISALKNSLGEAALLKVDADTYAEAETRSGEFSPDSQLPLSTTAVTRESRT